MTINYAKFEFKPLGKAIKEERKKLRLSRKDFSEIIGIHADYLIKIENYGHIPSLTVLHNIVTYLSISVDRYFYYTEYSDSKNIKIQRIEEALITLTNKELDSFHLNLIEYINCKTDEVNE